MRKITLTITLFFLFFAQAVLSQTIKYVTVNGAGTKDGSSWSNASDNLQKTISLSSGNTQVWIAKGTYTPKVAPAPNDNPKDRNNTFGLKKDVKLYGGFIGSETSISERNITTNETILSGNLGGGNYAHHVVFIHALEENENYYVNGVTISDGKCDVLGYYNVSKEVGGNSFNDNLKAKYPDWFVAMDESPYYQLASIGLQLAGFGSLPGVPSVPGGDIKRVQISNTSYPQSNGGGIYNVGGILTLENVTFKNNTGIFGAAVSLQEGARTTIKNSTFTNNTATNNGGAVVSNDSYLTITGGSFNNNSSLLGGAVVEIGGRSLNISGASFTNNKANNNQTDIGFGGAIFIEKVSNADSATRIIDNCTFNSNSAAIAGAIYAGENISNLKITNSTFTSNNALLIANNTLADGGGAIKLQNVINAEVTSNKFINNSASKGMGGACVLYDTNGVTFSGNTFSGNTSLLGGALCLLKNRNSTTISGNTFNGNSVTDTSVFSASGYGGALVSSSDNNVKISENTFTHNTATKQGGGIYFETSTVNSIINKNNFNTNSSQKFGGAIFASTPGAAIAGQLSLNENTFDNNSSVERGGGIFLINALTANVNNNTFTGNKAYIGAVVDIESSAKTNFFNNTIRANVGTTNSSGQSSGIVATLGGVSKICNNTFTGNEGFTALFYDNATVDFVNNTVWNEKSSFGIYMFSKNIKLYNNILEDVGGPSTSADVQNNSFRYTNNYVGSKSNVLETNLYFADEANNNFNLTGCSPILNKGNSSLYLSEYSSKDIAGSARKVDAIDIGAYENVLGVSGKSKPTVVSPQAFCNQAILNNLQATGSTIKWYSQALGGSPLASNTTLISGTTYYASQTVNGCESERASVAVSISSTEAPTAQSPQNFIIGQQGVKIVVNGSNLKWYSQEVGGTASTVFPSLNMSSENSATYWVSQTNANNCESTRTKIVVNVTKIPLTVKAIDKTKLFDGSVYGNSNYTVTYSGFESGDSVANSISGTLAFSGNATTATEPGVYKITPQGISSSKYTVLFEEGTIEIKSNLNLTDNILYVKQGVNGDGSSWSSPLSNLEVALTRAANINTVHTNDTDPKKVKKIYVAKGTYQLASGKSYIMPKNIEIYGGFDPDNAVTNLTHQRITGNLNDGSILKGNNNASVIRNDDNGLTGAAVLNGFTITSGNASNGGGIYNKKVSPKFENCIIKSNIATANGGAIYNESANTTWVNCLIISNTAPKGASIYNDASLPTLLNNTIADNTGTQGATLYNANASTPRIVNTISVKNSSNIFNDASSSINNENSLIQGVGGITQTTSVFDTNYELLTTSLALNTGNNIPLNIFFPTKDLKGKSRIIDATVDMGVFERNKTQTIAANNITKAYGDEPFIPDFKASSELPLEYISSSNTAIAKIEDGKIKVVGVGTATITVKQSGNDEYDAVSSTFILTAGKRTLTVTADNKVKLYDGVVFNGYTVSYSGFVFDDTFDNSLGGNLAYGGTALTATAIGDTYIIIPSGYTSSKYEISYSNGKLTIVPDVTLTNGTLYVKKGATGNGSSWTNALGEVRDALEIARIINLTGTKATKIFVSIGQYNSNSGQSFKMLKGVSMYGGFDPDNGITALTHKRKFTQSILSQGARENRVITNDNNGLTNTDIIDGFTIGGSGVNQSSQGGGIYNKNSSPTIVNCIIKDNSLFPFPSYIFTTYGGGIYNDNSSPVLINCIIKNNKVGVDGSESLNSGYYGYGSAMWNANNSSPKLYNCTITENKSISGNNGDAPAIVNDASSTTSLYNSIYMNNNKGVSSRITSYNSIVQKDDNITEGLYNNSTTVTLDAIFKTNSIALKEDSFAKDKGNNSYYSFNSLSTYDINGYTRLTATIDVGAEELRTPQTITATDLTKTYGEVDFIHPSAAVASSLPLTYTKSSNVTIATIKDGKIHILNPGTTTITITQVGNEVYAPTEKTFVLTVAKATLTVKANDKSKSFNNLALPNGDYSVSYTGFVNGEDSSKLTGTLQYSGNAVGKTDIGVYTDGITPSGLSSNYYDFVYKTGTLTIKPNTVLTNNTLYVKQGSVGGNGSSWELALNDLSLALRYATILNKETPNTVNKIYVAKGTYTPKYSFRDNSNFIDEGRDNSFLVLDGVKLYGGFDGNIAGESIADRNIQNNKTILDGSNVINHIITVSNAMGDNEVNGFTILKGAASDLDTNGAGSVTVNGKSINRTYGGGIRVHSSNVSIKNCVISENSSGLLAGGIYISDQSTASIYNTLFYGNFAKHYAANASSILIDNANVKIVNATFGDTNSGDGIVYRSHISTTGLSTLEVFNSIFKDNLFNKDINRTSGTVTIKNSLLSKAQTDSQYSSMTLANNSYAKPADFIDISTNNFALKATSAAIDKGDNTLYNLVIAGNKDIANSSRFLNTTIDMGCYESKLVQTINASDITKKYTDADFVIGTASSGLMPLTYTSDNNTVAYITKDNKIDIVGVGQATITVTQNGDEIYASTSKSFILTVEKGDISTSLNPETYTYDGSKKYLNINDLPTGASVSYEGNGQINAGEYVVKAIISGGQYYNDLTLSNTLKINKTVLSGITFTPNTFTYDGFDKHPEVSGSLPDGVNVVYSNTQKNAGAYNDVKATLSGSNYNMLVLTTSMTINKGDLSNAIFLLEKEEVYDGTPKKLSLDGILPDGVTPTYTNNDNVNVGSYDVTVNINGGVNYNNKQLIAKLIILKGNLAADVVLTPNTYIYDGTGKSLTIDGVLPDQVTVSYTNNNKIDVGSYKVYATLSKPNYNDQIVEADLIIEPKPLNVIVQGEISKVYNANTIVALNTSNFALEGVVDGDNVILNNPVAGELNNKNAGENKAVTINALRLSGADAKNYILSAASLIANIAKVEPKELDVSLKGSVTKIFDATTKAVLSDENYDLNGILENDIVTLNNPSLGEYDTKDVGTNKTITVSNLAVSGDDALNYVLNSQTTSGEIGEITTKAITVTADAKTKVYGAADPVLTYSVSPSLQTGDTFTGSLSRATGNSVGTYAIASSLNNTNYAITYTPAELTITAKAITVTADAKTKVYGAVEPILTYSVVPSLETGDAFTGSLSRAIGNNVGTYAIASTLDNSNYAITYAPADLTITTKAITVTADAKAKIYGAADPVLTYSVSPSLVGTDTFTGSLSRATGNNVGTYAIASSLNNTNYGITYAPADLTITTKAITVTADAKTKVYGAVDPVLTYSVVPSLETGDTFTGSLSRATGNNVGTYAIASSLNNTNYAITYAPAELTITAKAITVTADAKTKVYGAADPVLTYSVVPGLETGDTFTGSLSRATGNSVGTYAIASSLNNTNYGITYAPADLTITSKAITVTADAKTKVYGAADPVLTYSVVPSLETGDTFTGSLSRAKGNSVGTYAIASSLNNTNYAITYAPADLTITTKAITVTADAKTKVYGAVDPVLTYSVVPSLETGDTFTGSLSRATGNNVGTYAIASSLNNTNYAIMYAPADFTITKADQQITWNQTLGSGCDGETTTVLTATSSSGLAVSYTSSNGNIVTISNGSLVFENYGSANITAAQAGNNNYNAAQVVVLPIVNSQPNLIRKQFESVIFFDNSSNDFKSYSWYKNGVLVSGQTNQYFKENGALNGTYYAMATKHDETVITTCPLTLTSTVAVEAVKIVPNPVKSNTSFDLVTTLEDSKMQNAKINIFAINGALLQSITTNESTTTLQAPTVEGIYIITLTLSNGSYFTKNLLVKN
ncbi:MBG domain-containing protein [Flavobacterium sp. LM4]|uniref:MBG domain-containing protein n=1 Tax=Flavobacterium sp. LM4 TaxID=1938609 RepID=UPI000F502761|nr:MBG domain-containing protein [Flavobacterium sp. LM4]